MTTSKHVARIFTFVLLCSLLALLLPLSTQAAIGQQTQAPKVTGFTGVQAGQTHSGVLGIEALVSGTGIATVEFTLTGPKGTSWTEKNRPYIFLGNYPNGKPIGWKTTEYPNGDYTLNVVATNKSGQRGTGKIAFRIANGVSPQPTNTPAPTAAPTKTPTVVPTPTVAAPTPTAATPPQPAQLVFPDGFMKSIKDYGAKGDGATDDTAAIQKALDENRVGPDGKNIEGDYYGRPKALYFPAGTYLVNTTLKWHGCCVTLQGQGPGATIIKLKDGAGGFNDPSAPKPVLTMPSGNMAFHHNIFDMSFNTGKNNPGAVGIDYISSNVGSIKNITIVSGDGKGARGLDMTRQWPGPLLIKNVSVTGFDYGIHVAHAEYGPTFENITLKGQNVAGIFNQGNTLAIRKIISANTVPAIKTDKPWSSVIVLDGAFTGGAASNSAIDSAGYVYARNVTTSGYQSAIRQKGAVVPGASQAEYVSDKIYSLFDSPQKSLNLPIEETPEYYDSNMANWGKFTANHYGDTSKLQDLLNSGASTIYFPAGVYFSYNERAVVVPASVKRIIGFNSGVNRDARGVNGGGIKFIVEGAGSEPLIVERFQYGVKIEHKGKRPVAIKHGTYDYTAAAGAGKLFLEDVGIGDLRLQPGQQVWARQYNNESNGTKIVNNGASLWILGLKTERAGTVIETAGGGKTELLGTLIYPATNFNDEQKQRAAFINRESSQSLIYSVSNYLPNGNYPIQVEETRDGVTKRLMASEMPGRMPLFVGYK
jgi:hypothetical protein